MHAMLWGSSLVVFVLAGSLGAQALAWRVHRQSSVGNRQEHAMAFDARRSELVVFGGDYYGPNGDTRVFRANRWSLVKPKTSPSARSGHAMVFDSKRGRVVLFGGKSRVNWFGTTWDWDGANWKDATPYGQLSPTARIHHGMAFDSSRSETVLFGGETGTTKHRDTWVFNGTSWTRRTPTASPPAGPCAMAYDAVRKRTVLFCGETWEWDGVRWQKLTPKHTPPKTGAMTYDSHRQRVVLSEDGTWEWNGVDWRQLTPRSRYAITKKALAYHANRRLVYETGGFSIGGTLSETRTFGVAGTAKTYGRGCGSPAPFVLNPLRGYGVGRDLRVFTSTLPQGQTAALLAIGASNKRIGSVALPLDLTRLGFPGCFLYNSMDVVVPMAIENGRATWTIRVPLDQRLVGTRFYLQATSGQRTTNGLDVWLGYH